MSVFLERREKGTTVRRYKVEQITNEKSACEWIANVCRLSFLKVDHISFLDLDSEQEDCSHVHIAGEADFDTVFSMAKDMNFDIVDVSGEYKGRPICIGIDLRDYTVFIALSNSDIRLSEDIDDRLQLLK